MSTNDPFDTMYDFSNDAYDALHDDAQRDDRVGNHNFLVTSIEKGAWPDGQPRLKVKGNLTTAENAKTDWTFSPPPPPDVLARNLETMPKKMKRAIDSAITQIKQLGEHYGINPGQIRVGNNFSVKTVKTRVDADGAGGFIRIVAFLDKDTPVGKAANSPAKAEEAEEPTAASTVGF